MHIADEQVLPGLVEHWPVADIGLFEHTLGPGLDHTVGRDETDPGETGELLLQMVEQLTNLRGCPRPFE